MAKSLLIQNGVLISASAQTEDKTEKQADIRIKDGIVAEIGDRLTATGDETVIDAAGLWVTPGFIDLHTHLRDLGQSNREDIFTGTRAAACGGFTTVVAMANTDPPIDSKIVLSHLRQLISERAAIEVLPVANVTKAMAGQELTEMVELARSGAVAFSDDGMPVTNLAVLRRALEYAELAGSFIISHAEDKDLADGGVINESPAATKLGLRPIPWAAESACVAREIEVVRQTGGRFHFAHISTKASVELISQAKASGLRVTADVTPHHLVLLDRDITDFDTAYKMNPPLRSQSDQDALVKALQDGTLDAIATDHAPHSREDKGKTFDQAPFGVIGLETAFSLVYEKLVLGGYLSIAQLVELMTSKPAAVLNRTNSIIAKGSPANIAIINPKLNWVYDTSKGFSKSQNSPFNGKKMTGKIVITLYKGEEAYRDQRLLPSTVG